METVWFSILGVVLLCTWFTTWWVRRENRLKHEREERYKERDRKLNEAHAKRMQEETERREAEAAEDRLWEEHLRHLVHQKNVQRFRRAASIAREKRRTVPRRRSWPVVAGQRVRNQTEDREWRSRRQLGHPKQILNLGRFQLWRHPSR